MGWTALGEWLNVTARVAEASQYTAGMLYTSNRGETIAIDVNGKAGTGPLTIVSAFDAADPVAWRQWHHWNVAPGFAKLKLPKDKAILTTHILTEGEMNLATFDFRRVK